MKRNKKSGQSIIEFAFFLPLYLGLIYYLMQICMAINAGHVLQQYTRTRLYEMLYNHPEYPGLRWTYPNATPQRQGGWQRYWVGMDKEKWTGSDEDAAQRETGATPAATTVRVGSAPVAGDDEGNNFPPDRRQNVRVRIISFICMPPKLSPASATGPQFLTETNSDSVRNWFAGGFGSHVSFCED